MLEENIDKWH
jgi:dynein heavy chain 1, cytosolic